MTTRTPADPSMSGVSPVLTRSQRRSAIRDDLLTRPHVSVNQIVARFGISRSTAWRDIAAIVDDGFGEKVHGGITRFEATPPPDRVGMATPLVIGMQVPADHGHYDPIVEGAAQICREQGVRLHVRTVDYWQSADDVDDAIEDMILRGAHGLLITPMGSRRLTGVLPERFTDYGRPAILVERDAAGIMPSGFESVSTAPAVGVYAAADYLVGLGHRRLALIVNPERALARHHTELMFTNAITDLIPELGESHIWPTARASDFGWLVSKIRRSGVTGLIVHGDRRSVDICAWLAHPADGIEVPQKLSVVSYSDDATMAAAAGITVVTPPLQEVGRIAAQRMIDHLRGNLVLDGRRLMLQPRLAVYNSTAEVPSA